MVMDGVRPGIFTAATSWANAAYTANIEKNACTVGNRFPAGKLVNSTSVVGAYSAPQTTIAVVKGATSKGMGLGRKVNF